MHNKLSQSAQTTKAPAYPCELSTIPSHFHQHLSSVRIIVVLLLSKNETETLIIYYKMRRVDKRNKRKQNNLPVLWVGIIITH